MTLPNHYTLLSLPHPTPHNTTSPPTLPEIKRAYHLALLTHHPDKTSPSQITSPHSARPTIDALKTAYKTLSTPSLRTSYDRALLLSLSSLSPTPNSISNSTTPTETLDLSDLSHTADPGGGVWYRACRCGLERGFVVQERELERADDEGVREVLVSCGGCSLWVRVVFGVEEEEGEGKG